MRAVLCSDAMWGVSVFTQLAAARRLDLAWDLATGEGSLQQALRRQPGYLFFVNWARRVPAETLARATCVNLHATPLPYGRGGHPIENMLLRGHAETVVTAHQMTDEIDAGPIYAVSGPVSLAGAKEDILRRLVAPCTALIRTVLGERPTPFAQAGEVVAFRRLSREDYRTFWAGRQR